MSLTDKITRSYTGNGSAITSTVGEYTGNGIASFDDDIAAGATNVEIDITFPFASIQALAIVSSQDLTLKTNSTSTPGDTISIKGGVGIVWGKDFHEANPFTADVTKLFATNATTNKSTLKIRVLFDATP
jgi:hypothetical protein